MQKLSSIIPHFPFSRRIYYNRLAMDIDEVLTRGVDKIYPDKAALKKTMEGKKLRIYQGFDPTGTELHIGHMVGLRKLKQWQDLGHEVIFLIGDFTGRIGDPTGKEETRPLLSKEIVEKNAKTYKDQAGKILRFNGDNPVQVKFNSEWLDKLSMQEVFNLTSKVTYQQVIKRGLYQKRIKNEQDISINEIMYPIMQGYDSVAMDIDVEIGGDDQLFNMMMGRDLMRKMKNKEKFVMTTPLLTDSRGVKIGKTEGNVIALNDEPADLFGKIMSLADDVIVNGLEYLTDVPMREIVEIEKKIQNGTNPMQYKKQLALEVVKQLNDETAAQNAKEAFEKTFGKKEIPTDLETLPYQKSSVIDYLVSQGVVASKSEAKRLAKEGAIDIDGNLLKDGQLIEKGQIIKVGKKRFFKVAD